MAIIIILLFVFALLTMGGGAVLWLAFKQKQSSAKTAPSVKGPSVTVPSSARLPFRWRYVVVPVLVLFVSVVAAAYFFGLLPSQIAYHFAADGSADRWVGRGALMMALVAPQFLLAFLGAVVAHIVARVGTRFVQDGSTPAPAIESITTVMSNMVALPQLVLCFAMVDIFAYNAYLVHLPPLYIFAMAVMLVGGSILGLFFLRAIQQARATKR